MDRGGLKILNEHAFNFFKAMEIVFHYITTEKNKAPEAMMKMIDTDEDILFWWTLYGVHRWAPCMNCTTYICIYNARLAHV